MLAGFACLKKYWNAKSAGKYVFKMTQIPTFEDGSSFTATNDQVAFEVVKEDKADAKIVIPETEATVIEVTLEKVAVEDMSADQLKAAASVLEKNGKSEAAAKANSTASTKPATQPSNPGSNNGGSAGGSVSGGSSELSHTHNWVAQTQRVKTGSYIQCSCGATFSSNSAWEAHAQAQGKGNSHSYSVKSTYENQVVGYYCSGCGASK